MAAKRSSKKKSTTKKKPAARKAPAKKAAKKATKRKPAPRKSAADDRLSQLERLVEMMVDKDVVEGRKDPVRVFAKKSKKAAADDAA